MLDFENPEPTSYSCLDLPVHRLDDGSAKGGIKWSFVTLLLTLLHLVGAPIGEAQSGEVSPPSDSATEPGATTGPAPSDAPPGSASPPSASVGADGALNTPPNPPPAAQTEQPAFPAPAPAQPKLSFYDHFEVGGLLGYAVQLDSQPTHPFGVTLGARAGVELANHLYLGVTLVIFAGQSSSFVYDGLLYTGSLWQTQLGLEGGYDLKLGPLTLRPYAGVGINHMFDSITAEDAFSSVTLDEQSSTAAYVAGGGALHLDLTDKIYAGADARATLVFESSKRTALVVVATGGVKFF